MLLQQIIPYLYKLYFVSTMSAGQSPAGLSRKGVHGRPDYHVRLRNASATPQYSPTVGNHVHYSAPVITRIWKSINPNETNSVACFNLHFFFGLNLCISMCAWSKPEAKIVTSCPFFNKLAGQIKMPGAPRHIWTNGVMI